MSLIFVFFISAFCLLLANERDQLKYTSVLEKRATFVFVCIAFKTTNQFERKSLTVQLREC